MLGSRGVFKIKLMPATSKSQQQAAGIAHAVEKGELPKSKLKGASKQMYQGMAGKGELHKFAATKTGGLPKHVKESTEQIANLFGRSLIGEGGHKAGCQCGFCKNKGSFGKKAKENEKVKEKDMDEPSEPEVTEAEIRHVPWIDKTGKQKMVPRVDSKKKPVPAPAPARPPVKEDKTDVTLSKGVNLGGKAASAYHNMTSKQAMTPGWKTKTYIKAAGEISGNTKSGQMSGFKNKSAGETTSGKKLPKTRPGESRAPGEAAKQIVEALLG